MCWLLPPRGVSTALPALPSAAGTSVRVFPAVAAAHCVLPLTDAGCGALSPALGAASERACCVRMLILGICLQTL